MDLGTGLALLGSAKIIQKVLGPTAEYIGDGVKNWTEKRVGNVRKIFQKASARVETMELEELKSAVPPQLLMQVLEYGSFTEDDLIQEYLAGLLVSSRTGISNDNRSAVLCQLVQNMSVYQIRLHYLFYHSLRKVNLGNQVNLGFHTSRSALQTYISMRLIFQHVLITNEEKEASSHLIEHTIHGLNCHNLIESHFFYGSKAHIESVAGGHVPEDGVVLQPSILGIELFLWINAKGSYSHSSNYLFPGLEIADLADIEPAGNCFVYP
jgi:hypothetical protein